MGKGKDTAYKDTGDAIKETGFANNTGEKACETTVYLASQPSAVFCILFSEMHKGFVLWFTGLSGSGKSTLSEALETEFRARNYRVERLDGDIVRTNLSAGLSFSREDRDINVRRIGFVCDLLARNGVIAISAAISPFESVRDECRALAESHGVAFVEVYTQCSLEELSRRDVKGLYKRALAGEIPNFTGVSDPYEAPQNPEVVARSDSEPMEVSLARITDYLRDNGLIGD